jgi:hypothetical protein
MGQMKAAMAYLKDQDVPNYAAVAKLFDVKPTTLRRWFLGISTSRARRHIGAQSGSAKLTMAQSRSSIETYHVSTLERPELPTKTAEPWWPLRFADGQLPMLNTISY